MLPISLEFATYYPLLARLTKKQKRRKGKKSE